MEKEELAQIISEYEQDNNIECITEEELLDLIPESELWPNVYLPSYGRYSHSGIDIPDYDFYLLGKGINLVEGDTPEYLEYLEELQQTQDGIDLGDADRIDESEWECSLVEDLEHYLSLRTETVKVYVTDACEAIKWWSSVMDDTTLHLRIHCDAGDGKFLIVKTNMEDLYFYRVYLESQFDEKGRYKQLGTCIDSNDVIKIIRYYLKTGEFYGHK